jgi:uncharacterized repeat protein (TIGR03847 family)
LADEGFNEIEALDVQFIRPEALGEPGSRRFRLVVVINGRTIIAWMEKEQVRRLGELLLDVIERLPKAASDAEKVETGTVPNEISSDQFRAGRMELSYDEEDDRLVVIIHDIEADDDALPALAFRLTRAQTRQFSIEADDLVQSGRPTCPLCGRPMGPGNHVCEKQNGHVPH